MKTISIPSSARPSRNCRLRRPAARHRWRQGAAKFTLKSASVELSTSDCDFQGADAKAINANCLSCHSAGMVLYQPHLGNAGWTTIVEKMRHAYKAPVPDTDVTAIV